MTQPRRIITPIQRSLFLFLTRVQQLEAGGFCFDGGIGFFFSLFVFFVFFDFAVSRGLSWSILSGTLTSHLHSAAATVLNGNPEPSMSFHGSNRTELSSCFFLIFFSSTSNNDGRWLQRLPYITVMSLNMCLFVSCCSMPHWFPVIAKCDHNEPFFSLNCLNSVSC